LGLHLWERRWRFHAVASHPAIIAQKSNSPRWRLMRHGTQTAGDDEPIPASKDTRGVLRDADLRQLPISPLRERDQREPPSTAGPSWGEDDDIDALIGRDGSPG
jgi:hypothetical protein